MAKNILGRCFLLVMMAAVCLLQGCSSKGFKVTAEIKGLGNQNVRVVYKGADGGIVDSWIMAQNNALEITGDCSSPTLLIVYNGMNVPIMRLVVSGGDKLEVKGSVTEQYQLQVKGSEVMEQLNDFILKHKTEYSMPSSPKLNAAIEEYVKANPKSLVSTLLVMLDYAPSDDNKVAQLLNSIDESAKPKAIMDSYNLIAMRAKAGASSITSFNLLEMKSDDFEVATLTGTGRRNVLLFWDKDMEAIKRDAAFEELRMLDSTLVNIMDINIDSDSVQWRNIVGKTSTTWKHYWAPGSMMNSQLMRLQINSTPTVIVTDSLGKVQYRGTDPIKARQTAES